MRKLALLIVVVAVGLLLSLPNAARADFNVAYPGGAVGLALNVGPGFTVFVLINEFGDVHTMHSDAFSDPVLGSLAGFPLARALFLFFLDITPAGARYDLYVDQGSGFFFVDTVVL
jgi:hypothetical protein